ncbi:NADPH oxidase [Haematobia irritans]|uniref:NADPH oxidase n=1 Tax=Haematobia irritans TaxID=7368 RepID=UPI003F4F9370
MENNYKLTINTNIPEQHRGSVSSTNSLEVPPTPTRSPKKVSFSDDLPIENGSSSAPIIPATSIAIVNINASKSSDNMTQSTFNQRTTSDYGKQNSNSPQVNVEYVSMDPDSSQPPYQNPLDFMLNQAAQYLEKLHGPAITQSTSPQPNSTGQESQNHKFKSSLNIDINPQALDVADGPAIITNTPSPPISKSPSPPPAILEIQRENSRSGSVTPTGMSTPSTMPAHSTKSSSSSSESSTTTMEPPYKPPRSSMINGNNGNPAMHFNLHAIKQQNPPNVNSSSGSSEMQEISEEHAVKYMQPYNLNLDKNNFSSMELEAKRDKIRWLLISECSALLGEGKHTREGFRKLFLQEEFQKKLFSLFDLDGNGYLVQDRWIEHLKGRLTDDRQMDYAEQLESVAYVICGENSKITFRNFNEIWNARGILDKLYRLIDNDGTNSISTNQIMEFISHVTNARPRTGFDKSSLARLEQLFRNTVGNEREIRREEFKKIVISKNPFFTERVFQIFDKDNSGSISLQEFIDAIQQFSGQSADDKIRFLFKVYDIDGDGLIQHKELHDVIRACMEENGMEFSEDQIEDLTTAMFEDADPYNRGEITYEALKNQLHKHGGLLENLSITIDRWLVPLGQEAPANKSKSKLWNSIPIPHQLTPAYMRNNHVFVTYLFLYIAINVCLFVSRAIQYRASNGFVIMARSCGQCLNFNCAWVLVLMLRHTLTYLRSRGLSTYLPVDNHIYLHKLTGIVISVFSLIHTIMHLFNFSMIVVNDPNINAGNYTIGEWLLTERPGLFGLIPGCANPTGIALIVILLIMFICSQPFVRRKGSFEVFYWTHLLYIPFWILLLFHGPNFWKWFLAPGIIYIVERVLRFVWMRGDHGKTYISSGLLLPSKVIHLVIKRPYNFNFRPGDYVFVNIPVIANYEWHPFTISSAPEQEDYMWLHIRTVGEWTNRLYRYFEKEQQRLHKGDVIAHKQAIPTSSLLQISEENSRTTSPTPQTDFLAQNLSKIQHSSSFDSALVSKTLQDMQMSSPTRSPRHNYTPSKLATESVSASHVEATSSTGSDRIRSIKKSLQRTFSRKDQATKEKRLSGHSNDGFVTDENDLSGTTELGKRRKLKKLLADKPPLEKSISMPDIGVKTKKRDHFKALHTLGRSESERSFDQARIRRARLQSLGLAYMSPQNKSLAQSFRYMRHKPTIIAFKTPSVEESEPQFNADQTDSVHAYNALQAEEGRVPADKFHNNDNNEDNPELLISKHLEDYTTYQKATSNTTTNNRLGRFRRPTFLRSLSTSIKNRGSSGSIPANGTTNSGGKVTLDAGVLEIFIDGPYGAPSSHIFMAQHAVLIGTGIGVTPFASILQSIMHRYWKARHSCPRCLFEWASDIPKTVMNLRKVDFFWINRDQRSFEWFVNLLSQLEIEQAELGGAMERFLDMHMYITSALQRTDMKAVGLQLALDLLHEKGKRDLITGLKTRTNAGRPNWDKVFKQLQAQKKGKVTVFYCGPPQLAKTLRVKCDQYGFAFRKECF